MSDVIPNTEQQRLEFYANRGHADAKAVADHARAAIQTVILINGGAATALLAFASRANVAGVTQQDYWLALGLFFFVLGVLAGAYNIRLLTDGSASWMMYWDHKACQIRSDQETKLLTDAGISEREGRRFFTMSLVCFALGSMTAGTTIIFNPAHRTILQEPATSQQ